jgi:hypothetical protein
LYRFLSLGLFQASDKKRLKNKALWFILAVFVSIATRSKEDEARFSFLVTHEQRSSGYRLICSKQSDKKRINQRA